MKKILLLFFYTCNAFAQLPNSNDFTLKGHITRVDAGMLYIRYRASNRSIIIDSSKVFNGNFEFSGKISQPVVANISMSKNKEIIIAAPYMFLEPAAMTLDLANDPFSIVSLKGSKTHDELMIYKNADNALKQKFIGALNNSEKNSNAALQKSRQDSLVFYNEQKHLVEYDFIKNHPKSYIIPELLVTHYRYYTAEQLGEIYNNMGAELQENPGVKYIFATIPKTTNSTSGVSAPLIVGKDFITHADFNLASLKGSYVLLDFWGSWCQPCIKLLPDLVQETKKYKDKKIAFVSVCYDSESNQNKCKDIIKKLGMNWVNIWSSMDKKDPGSISNVYNVGVYPTYILIDPTGKIANRFDGEYGYYKCKNVLDEILK
jgi:thiol-disulfide isomerase/thioredoxin